MRLRHAPLLAAALLLGAVRPPTVARGTEVLGARIAADQHVHTLRCGLLVAEEARPQRPPRLISSPPAMACLTLLQAYQALDLATYSSLLTDDFRFIHADQDLRRRWPQGWTREDELASADHLFHGVVRPSGERLPAARVIRFDMDSMRVEPDPEHPDSPGDHALVVVSGLRMAVCFADGSSIQTPAEHHELQMVRRVPGAGERGPGWQVQRWVEGDPIRPLTATRATRRDSTPRNASDPGVRVELAIVQPPVPMRPPYVLAFTLPSCGSGALEMMDVTGRRLARHDFGGLGPGRQSVALDVGRALPPGIYWARLTQGGRIVTARLILIR